ncbi:hypothetical protein BZA05DRAFT_416264 [Tricharina praecox]|uniref:uncharacterized protein n=1 Tax=Tricharina praecox TaxID=43433 RepID=UPI00221FBDF3|nr:uncharacterized protein BZA05DRAFT_416264 [Tricharina praecox]KAI5856611.1 hypothetical protein BZA05DRAFT_416264 [Tricharina praecox]
MADPLPAPIRTSVLDVSDVPETKAAENPRLSEEPTAVPQADHNEPDDGEADDSLNQGDATDTSEDEDADEPQGAPLRENYTHENLCVMPFFRDDLGNDRRSVVRMYNEYWYPDHPPGIYKDALYSRYKKAVPSGNLRLVCDRDVKLEIKEHSGWTKLATHAPAPRHLGVLTLIISNSTKFALDDFH